jgi:hypothetical protein
VATLTAEYLADLGRVRLTLTDTVMNVRYRLQRSVDAGATWQDVRGGGAMGDTSITVIDDYEYVPNQRNDYRVLEPTFFDSFNRAYPSAGTLELSGEAGSNASTPDAAALDITGDIDLRVNATLTWGGVQQGLIGKWAFAGEQRSYLFTVEANGRLGLYRSTSGTAATQTFLTSTVAVPVTSGRLGVRVTLDVNNGAAGHTATFYTSSDSGVFGPWVQLGSPVIVAGTITNFSSTSPLEVGAWDLGTNGMMTGQIHYAQARNGIGGPIVANPIFADQAAGTTNFVDSAGRTWTVGAEAEIITIAPVPGFDWGTADTGQAWNLGSSSTGFSMYVNNGVGVITSSQPAGQIAEVVTDQIPGAEDAEITWSAIYASPAVLLDTQTEWAVGLRAANSSNAYVSTLNFLTDADDYGVQLRIGKFVANSFTGLTAPSVVGTWVSGTPWHVRFRVQGSTLSARAWQEGTEEPANWDLVATDTDLVAGTGVYARGFKASGSAYEQRFGPMALNTVPPAIGATVFVIPEQLETYLKSVTFPLLNRELDCVDWDELSRDSRAGFFDIKGRHEILAIADVGSSGSFSLVFVTDTNAELRGVRALLTYGGILYLQPPGDIEEDCPTDYSGIPDGYVMWDGSIERHSVRGTNIRGWSVGFTRVATSDTQSIIPTTITWQMLWDMIGPEGTWEDVWAMWPTWQELWLTQGNISSFGEVL